jgi:hypothetical protein
MWSATKSPVLMEASLDTVTDNLPYLHGLVTGGGRERASVDSMNRDTVRSPKAAGGQGMKEFAKVVLGHLSPVVDDIVYGIGLGYDPAPCEYRITFINSDWAAFLADAEALYLDSCHVYNGIEHHSPKYVTEARHHGRSTGSAEEAIRTTRTNRSQNEEHAA